MNHAARYNFGLSERRWKHHNKKVRLFAPFKTFRTTRRSKMQWSSLYFLAKIERGLEQSDGETIARRNQSSLK